MNPAIDIPPPTPWIFPSVNEVADRKSSEVTLIFSLSSICDIRVRNFAILSAYKR